MGRAMDEIGKLIERPRPLARKYKRLTGRSLGITGEVAEHEAARLLGLKLVKAYTPGYDAVRGRERLQIKGRIGPCHRLGAIRGDREWDAVIFVLLDEDLRAVEIWKAGRAAVRAELRRVRGGFPVATFKRIGRRVWPRRVQ